MKKIRSKKRTHSSSQALKADELQIYVFAQLLQNKAWSSYLALDLTIPGTTWPLEMSLFDPTKAYLDAIKSN